MKTNINRRDRRNIRLIECNAKCCYIDKLTGKGTLRQVFYLSEAPSPPMAPYYPLYTMCACIQYTYLHREGGGEQGCEWTDKSVNRDRESRTRIGSDATFFWDSLSNLVIDDNFRISNNLGLGLAANISTALPIQPDRDREIEII